MKTVFSLLNPALSYLTVALCFVPLILVWWKKLSHTKTYLFIVIYWLANGLVNLPDCLGVRAEMQNQLILAYNLLDTPLALLIFLFSSEGKKRQVLFYLLLFFLVLEPAVILLKGHNFKASAIIVGAGGFAVLFFSFSGLANYFNKIEHTPMEKTMGFVCAGFIFVYGITIITIFFNYLNFKRESLEANLFLYYLSLILAIMLTNVGLWKHAQSEFQRA